MIANVFNSKFNRWSHKDQFSFFVLLLRNRRERWEIRIKTLISVNWHPRYHIFFGQPRKLWNAIKTIHSFFLLQKIMVTTCSSQLLGFAKCQLKLILLWKLNELCRWPLASAPQKCQPVYAPSISLWSSYKCHFCITSFGNTFTYKYEIKE